MQRSLLLAFILLTIGGTAATTQQATNDANPLYRAPSIHIGSISVPPIAGAPFSATALIENQQPMPDGSVVTTRDVNLIGRDSRGRTHGENRPWVPDSFKGMPPPSEAQIYDPQTRINTIYYPATHVATQQLRPESRSAGNLPQPSGPFIKVEVLGLTTIDNIDVKGTRRTVTIPAQANGTGAAITVVDEYWYSEDLHVNVILRHNDPRTGFQTVALSNIKREEPPESFFQVPPDHKIVDLTPPPGSPATRGAVAGPIR